MRLSKRDKAIIGLLNESSLYMSEIGKKFGLTRQRVWSIAKRAEELGYIIDRPKIVVNRHRIDRCEICDSLKNMYASGNDVNRDKILKVLKISESSLRWHLRLVKLTGSVPLEFATVRNEKLARAVDMYRKTNLVQ